MHVQISLLGFAGLRLGFAPSVCEEDLLRDAALEDTELFKANTNFETSRSLLSYEPLCHSS